MRTKSFLPGVSCLLEEHGGWLAGARIGVLSHLAAVDRLGRTAAAALRETPGVRVTALLGPEHGFFGVATAGERTSDSRHPSWRIPIFSLYGATRKPTARMLKDLDIVVFDLQDLGVRMYTYVSTLRCLLEAAAQFRKTVIVADRPVPLPRVVDGPMLDPACASFSGAIPAPMVYGMTPGETALWLRKELGLSLDLRVAPMRGYRRESARGRDWPPWIPPSPGIRSWESALCYAATVFSEALPAVDAGRTTPLAFQVIGAPWINGPWTCEALVALRLPGVAFHPHPYAPAGGPYAGRLLDGVRMTVTDPASFRPALTAVSLIATLQRRYGRKRLWREPAARPEFFDKLFGTPSVREALLDAEPATTIAARWRRDLEKFRKTRRRFLLYPSS